LARDGEEYDESQEIADRLRTHVRIMARDVCLVAPGWVQVIRTYVARGSTDADTRTVSRRAWDLLIVTVLAAGLATLLGAAFTLGSTAHSADGAICGSVWHWHSSSVTVQGGEVPDAERAALSAQCHRDAMPRYDRAMALVAPGVVAVGVGLVGWVVASRKRMKPAH
jgi:hypothetical protein